MADNVVLDAGTGGDTVAADDIAGVKFPRGKLTIGADGVNDGDVSATNPLPIYDAGGSITVDGTVGVTGTFWQATQPVSVATIPSHDVTNAGTFATQAAQSGTWNIGTVTTVTTVAAVTAITNALPAGTNNIGDVDVLTQPARAATTDTITAKIATDAIQNGTTALTPKFATIAASTSGNNTLISAVTGKKIRVLAYNLIGNGAVNAKFQSGASGTDLTGLKYIAAAGGGICAPFNPVGWFETGSATLLNLNLSAAVAVGGEIVYVEV